MVDSSSLLDTDGVNLIQRIIGKLYYYVRAVDHTMLVALGGFATKQTLGTASQNVMEDVYHFSNCVATHPDECIQYHASGMVLHVDSDTSYISVRKSRSRVGGFHYLSLFSANIKKPPVTTPLLNGPLYAVCAIMKNVMASAAEAKMGALFINGQEVMILRTILEKLGYQQPPTPIRTDNLTAPDITNNTIRQIRFRSMDMRF